jgi:hypothetical protein
VRLTFLQGRRNKQRKRGIRKERIKGKKKKEIGDRKLGNEENKRK